ncbi:MAG: hypothetical protein VB876_16740 [Pirellulales bacterium]
MENLQFPEQFQQWANLILVWVGYGTLAGLLAKAIMPGRDPGGAVATLCMGIGGAVIGCGWHISGQQPACSRSVRWASWWQRQAHFCCCSFTGYSPVTFSEKAKLHRGYTICGGGDGGARTITTMLTDT